MLGKAAGWRAAITVPIGANLDQPQLASAAVPWRSPPQGSSLRGLSLRHSRWPLVHTSGPPSLDRSSRSRGPDMCIMEKLRRRMCRSHGAKPSAMPGIFRTLASVATWLWQNLHRDTLILPGNPADLCDSIRESAPLEGLGPKKQNLS